MEIASRLDQGANRLREQISKIAIETAAAKRHLAALEAALEEAPEAAALLADLKASVNLIDELAVDAP